MRHPCTWPGCPAAYVRPEYAARHAQELHFVCTCGRNFTARGTPAHRASVKRHHKNHPPFPRLPIGVTAASKGVAPAEDLPYTSISY